MTICCLLLFQHCWLTAALGDAPTSGPATTQRAAIRRAAPGLSFPQLDYEDAAFLVGVARRAFREGLKGAEWVARYRPASLADRQAILHVTLRSRGAIVAEAESPEMGLVDGAAAVGAQLARAAIEKRPAIKDQADELGIEFEWLGPREPVAAKFDEAGRWTDALLHSFEPAAEGIGVAYGSRSGVCRPSLIVSLNFSPDLALKAAETVAEVRQIDKIHHGADIHYFRFQSYHAWQPDARSRPTVLLRGEEYVPPAGVSAEGLDAAIGRMGSYLRYRQNRDGWFSEEYLPSLDRYSDRNAAVVQVRALEGLCTFADWTGASDDLSAAARGIRRNLPFLKKLTRVEPEGPTTRPLTTTQAGEALMFPGHESHLHITALLLSAIEALRSRTDWNPERVGLCEALLASQDADGRFEMALQGGRESASENVLAAGQCLIALGRRASEDTSGEGSEKRRLAFSKALRHYNTRFQGGSNSISMAAMARGFCLGYAATNDARMSDAAFDIIDRLVALQATTANCPWPELHGGVSGRLEGFVGSDTAEYLLAFAEGLRIARRIGDRPRIDKYMSAVRAAARFVMQLEVREPGCYYIRSPRDALRGVRSTPWSNVLRVEDCAGAVNSLILAREALFGARDGRR